VLLSAGGCCGRAGMATKLFPQNATGPKAQLVRLSTTYRVAACFPIAPGAVRFTARVDGQLRVAGRLQADHSGFLPCASSVGCLDFVAGPSTIDAWVRRFRGPLAHFDRTQRIGSHSLGCHLSLRCRPYQRCSFRRRLIARLYDFDKIGKRPYLNGPSPT